MSKSLSKLILVFTVLSALVGQAMAIDTMSFEMAIDNKHYNSNSESNCSTNMSHGMRVDSSSSENASIKDCCNTSECTCPPGGCTHAPVLIASMMTVQHPVVPDASFGLFFQQPVSVTSSLFRPPIFA